MARQTIYNMSSFPVGGASSEAALTLEPDTQWPATCVRGKEDLTHVAGPQKERGAHGLCEGTVVGGQRVCSRGMGVLQGFHLN